MDRNTIEKGKDYVIGMDFGTDSVRALLVDAADGCELASAVFPYPRWSDGKFSDPARSMFRQHPSDYIEGLTWVITEVLAAVPGSSGKVRAISVDTTASTPCLTDGNLVPLSLNEKYATDPDAMFVLWKDHTGEKESREINELCKASAIDYSMHTGFHYSSECFWSKVLHLLRANARLRADAASVIELCDFIPALLTGCTNPMGMKPGHCVAGQKVMWSEKWGGYPPEDFFAALDEGLLPLLRNMNPENYTCDHKAGVIAPEWAVKLGLPHDVVIGVGNVDSHSGAVGAGINEDTMVLNLGTSACYMAVVKPEKLAGRIIDGVFGQVDDSIVPGYTGFEIGLSAFGDIFAWLRRLLTDTAAGVIGRTALIDSTTKQKLIGEISEAILPELNHLASQIEPDEDSPFATDWLNGRRSPSPDTSLFATISGLRLSTGAPGIYAALVESAAFATKAIIDHLALNGVGVERLIAVGGISRKAPYVMQTLCDVLGKEIDVSGADQSCALGAAMYAAVAAGIYDRLEDAQQAMCQPSIGKYIPNPVRGELHLRRYGKYIETAKLTEKLTADAK